LLICVENCKSLCITTQKGTLVRKTTALGCGPRHCAMVRGLGNEGVCSAWQDGVFEICSALSPPRSLRNGMTWCPRVTISWQLQCPLPSSKPATSQKRAADVPQVASSDINKTFDSAVDRPLADVETRFLAKQSASIGDLRAWEKHNAPARTASSRRECLLAITVCRVDPALSLKKGLFAARKRKHVSATNHSKHFTTVEVPLSSLAACRIEPAPAPKAVVDSTSAASCSQNLARMPPEESRARWLVACASSNGIVHVLADPP